jgi:metal-responsive CopG/Arc/MetJ family transcriptional regulator
MKNITINLAEPYVITLEKMIQLGLIPNRSEGVRQALAAFITEQRIFESEIDTFLKETDFIADNYCKHP